MKKKHQVFVSSTSEDLLDERKAISEAILECDCFPSGMELFPASNNRSWDIIKKVIDDSDYYLLVIAGRYGSTRRIGNSIISYTEMEYNYAVKTHKPILAFIYNGNISNLPFGKVDPDETTRQLLKRFREKVKNKGRQVAFWTDTPSLVSKVKQALQTAIKETPTSGWIKCSDIGISGTDEECERLHDLTERWNLERIFRTRAEKNHESDPMLESHDIKS